MNTKRPCKFDHNYECLICDCWASDCAYNRYLNDDKYEPLEESVKMFGPKFEVGDKLIANDFDKEHYGLEFVEITEVNLENQVYHWEAQFNGFGKLHSGYSFKDAKLYIE